MEHVRILFQKGIRRSRRNTPLISWQTKFALKLEMSTLEKSGKLVFKAGT